MIKEILGVDVVALSSSHEVQSTKSVSEPPKILKALLSLIVCTLRSCKWMDGSHSNLAKRPRLVSPMALLED